MFAITEQGGAHRGLTTQPRCVRSPLEPPAQNMGTKDFGKLAVSAIAPVHGRLQCPSLHHSVDKAFYL
jgi:hypothetical protein